MELNAVSFGRLWRKLTSLASKLTDKAGAPRFSFTVLRCAAYRYLAGTLSQTTVSIEVAAESPSENEVDFETTSVPLK
jgi:hypothetical protein